MFTNQVETRETEQTTRGGMPTEAVIRESVLHGLGEPDNLHLVRVRQVFGDKYRVNVYVRADAATYKVAQSYFLEADAKGKVLNSTPAILRLY